ncbi:MAG TPA: serine/threonine-protein phosphatase [Desulfurobacteriaceae bacterium]|nr:serine/threonine-protein phosphatase [Desulfurobacteriaceae bacterium]
MILCKYFMDKGSRNYQEDTIVVDEKIFQEEYFGKIKVEIINKNKALFAVLDGMGGGEAGDFISYFVAKNLVKIWKEALKDRPLEEKYYIEALKFIQSLTERIFFEGNFLEYSGTTLAAVVIDKNIKEALSFNVGDSRVYLLRKNKLKLLTKDHSLVQKLIDAGLLKEEERIYHPQKHIITFGLGPAFKDVWLEKKEKIYFNKIKLKDKDVFFLSTDGIHDYLEHKKLEKFLIVEKEKESGLVELIKEIFKIGAPDNFSFIYVQV